MATKAKGAGGAPELLDGQLDEPLASSRRRWMVSMSVMCRGRVLLSIRLPASGTARSRQRATSSGVRRAGDLALQDDRDRSAGTG